MWGVLLGVCLAFWSGLLAAAGLALSDEERAWIKANPMVRYGVVLPEGDAAARNDRLAQAIAYIDALCVKAGLVEQFLPHASAAAAREALARGEIDVLVLAAGDAAGGDPAEGGADARHGQNSALAERWPPLAVGSERPLLRSILEKSQRAFGAAGFAGAPRPAAGGDAAGGWSSGGECAAAFLTLAAGSGALVVLVWLWSQARRRGLRREIERNAALFDAFFTGSPAGMAILDRDLRFVRINAPLARLHGETAASHLGRSVEQVVPDLADIIAPLMREVLITGRSAHNIEVALRRAADPRQESHWLVSLFPIPAPSGRNPLGVGEIVLDIGDRKRAELALRESENRLRNITDHLPVAVFQYRCDDATEREGQGGFTYLSDGISRILHLDPERLFAAPAGAIDCIHPRDRAGLRALLVRLATQAQALPEIEWTGRLATPDGGDDAWIQVRASAEITAGGRLSVSGVVLDVSQLKRVQQALERSRAELRSLGAHREGMVEREHQRLAREFHDELGQLLTTARMHLQLLTRLIDSDPAQAKPAVQAIDAMIVDAYRSIKNIASDLRPAALNLGLTAAIEWLVERMLSPLGIVCTVRCAPEADRLGDDFAIALFRIVQESLTNIVRHAQARRVGITIRHEGSTLRLRVEDDGRGFDAARVDRVRQFGLLGIAERVATLGGELDLVSSPGAGTRIEVLLRDVPFKSNSSSATP